jgi:Uncharacterized alpha/beta hydrolase domain (DUF2235)
MKVVKRLAVILLLGVVAADLILLAVNSTAQNGALLGLLFGVLSTPSRIAGVDFRQWLRNPVDPLPVNDDSAIGLTRTAAYATLGAAALLFAFGSLFVSPSPWLPHECRAAYDWGFVQLPQHWDALRVLDGTGLLERLRRLGVDGFFVNCHGSLSALKLAGGLIVGLALMHGLFELTWRRGLALLPNPRQPTRLLAPQPPPSLPARPARPAGYRRLIVCCDGTWNWPESQRETNVIRLVRAIEPVDPNNNISQIVHYHLGVGTGNILDRIVGGGAGVGLSNSVKACYGFLCDNYRPGDEIFLFGFSRGAYVARSVAGVVGTVGILHKSEMERFFEVWDWYSQPRAERRETDLMRLAPNRHQHVEIECVGVWDTVGALGIPGSRFCAKAFAFYETELGTHVRHAFQALAIDERRGNFQAAIWVPRLRDGATAQPVTANQPQQVLKQVWFPGVHSNIGGGYERHGLSDTTFLWMLAQLQPDGEPPLLGIARDCAQLALDPSEPYPTGTLQNSLTLFWRLIGSPIPRPVGIISRTERVHESAWLRTDDDNNICPVPPKDIYRREHRQDWLAAMDPDTGSLRVARAPLERNLAVTQPGPPPSPPRLVSSNIGVCGRLLRFIGGSG